MKVAIVHDWLVTYAGAERVLEQLINLYPDADLFSLVDHLPPNNRGFIKNKQVETSFIQKLPFSKKYYRQYLPFMPIAIEQFDLSAYDLIVSSSHAVAKGVITGPDQIHISYIHSPMRYAWDLQHQYLEESGLKKGIKGWIVKYILHKMRIWDSRTANNVDYYIANSNFISRRIWKVYRREAHVIYPPVYVGDFTFCSEKEDFYLTVSRMVPYKKIDLIVKAFSTMPEKKLFVIGEGPEFDKIKAQAGSNVILLGYQPFDVLKDYMQRAKAFVFAAEEDFGIIPVEAQACGTPVIAYDKGGVKESVQGLNSSTPTGVFFGEQTIASLTEAIEVFESNKDRISPHACRENAERFSTEIFMSNIMNYIRDHANNSKSGHM